MLVLVFAFIVNASHSQAYEPKMASTVQLGTERGGGGGVRCGSEGEGQCLPAGLTCLVSLIHTDACPHSQLCCLGHVQPSGEVNGTRRRTAIENEKQSLMGTLTRSDGEGYSEQQTGELWEHFGNPGEESDEKLRSVEESRGPGKAKVRKVRRNKSRMGMLTQVSSKKQKNDDDVEIDFAKRDKRIRNGYKKAKIDKRRRKLMKKRNQSLRNRHQKRKKVRDTRRKLSVKAPQDLETSRVRQDTPEGDVNLLRRKQRKCKTRPSCKNNDGICKKSCKKWQSPISSGECKGKSTCHCCAPVCAPKRRCGKKGGTCRKSCSSKENEVDGGCKSGCRCCMPIKECVPNARCNLQRGRCKTRCEDTEIVVVNGCDGKGCVCCAQESLKCPQTPSCPGYCARSCPGVVSSARCAGTACLCCLDCRANSVCKEKHGMCKPRCSCGEKEIPSGCSGDGCKCCVADIVQCQKSPMCSGYCIFKPLCTGDIRDETCGQTPGCACCSVGSNH